MCWPETPAGSQARLPCASYISVFDKNGKLCVDVIHCCEKKRQSTNHRHRDDHHLLNCFI